MTKGFQDAWKSWAVYPTARYTLDFLVLLVLLLAPIWLESTGNTGITDWLHNGNLFIFKFRKCMVR